LPDDALCKTSFRIIPKEFFWRKKDDFVRREEQKSMGVTVVIFDVSAFFAIFMNP